MHPLTLWDLSHVLIYLFARRLCLNRGGNITEKELRSYLLGSTERDVEKAKAFLSCVLYPGMNVNLFANLK